MNSPESLRRTGGTDRPLALGDRIYRLCKQVGHGLHARPVDRRHVFVAGVQRSGTNLLMQVLDRIWDTDVYHETDSRAFDRYEMRPQPVIEALMKRSRAPVFVLKSLCELQDLEGLMKRHAPAKTLWMLRGYEEVTRSMLASFGNFVRQAHRLAADKAGSDWRGRGMSDATQEVLREAVEDGLDEASAAALMWYYRNVLFFEQGFANHPEVRVVRYESLLEDPQLECGHIATFLGLPLSPRAVAAIVPRTAVSSGGVQVSPLVRRHCDALMRRFAAL